MAAVTGLRSYMRAGDLRHMGGNVSMGRARLGCVARGGVPQSSRGGLVGGERRGRGGKAAVASKGFGELLSMRKGSKGKKKEGGLPKTKLVKGKVSPKLEVPAGIALPSYAKSGRPPSWDNRPQIHDEEGVARMREAGALARRVLDRAGELAVVGTTTDAIDKEVHRMIIEAGAYPSPLNYGGFPKSVCTSINECVCHGIPDDRQLQDGDIVNIDVTVFLNGYHGDTSRTFCVGNVSAEAERLVDDTREALNRAIKVCRPGSPIKQIGAVIQSFADERGYGTVRDFTGHGVGKLFHSGPTVLHFRNNERGVMRSGQTFTIEPMLTMGKPNSAVWSDDWTAVTIDGKLTAQFEHTLLITDDGVETLT